MTFIITRRDYQDPFFTIKLYKSICNSSTFKVPSFIRIIIKSKPLVTYTSSQITPTRFIQTDKNLSLSLDRHPIEFSLPGTFKRGCIQKLVRSRPRYKMKNNLLSRGCANRISLTLNTKRFARSRALKRLNDAVSIDVVAQATQRIFLHFRFFLLSRKAIGKPFSMENVVRVRQKLSRYFFFFNLIFLETCVRARES